MNYRSIKKLLFALIAIATTNVFAGPIDEAMYVAARTQGTVVYTTCIVTPPVTAAQQATCASLYKTYIVTLTALNIPYPLTMSLDPDPYLWSPYDICKYETGHIVFGDQLLIPYCPSI